MLTKKIYIISYKNNENQYPTHLPHVIERYEKAGFETEIIEGYSLMKNADIKKNEVCFKNILYKVIPFIKSKEEDGFLISEDDAYLKDGINYAFLNDRMKPHLKDIVRIGYQKILSNYIVGTQLIYIPSFAIEELQETMESKRPQHFDGFLTKIKGIKLLDPHIQKNKKKKYVDEVQHFSYILDNVRKGKIIN